MLGHDFRNPDYSLIYRRRLDMLRQIRTDPEAMHVLRAFYREHPWQFVADWGMTYDPRNIGKGRSATVPFIPFPRQVEMMRWIFEHWRSGKDGVVPKSRDTGASWVAIALSCTLCLFYDGMAIGFGSRKEEYVDRLDSPKSLFYKARVFLQHLPPDFRGGWDREKHGAFMRLTFPLSGSVITGEAGDNLGRGDRTGLYFVDESAHLARPQLAEEALSATTECRIDLSSVNGSNTPFSIKRRTWPSDDVFTFHWRDDPRKDEAWYANLKLTKAPEVIAQEYDLDENASVTGVVIPSEWVQAAIDAHVKLGLQPSGKVFAGLDVADEGADMCAFAGRRGILLDRVEEWSGKGADIFGTVEKAFALADAMGCDDLSYDGDGLGAGVKGDGRVINERRRAEIKLHKFQGSGGVIQPDAKIPQFDGDESRDKDERTNKDYFANRKAQSWWALRMRFLRTYRAVVKGHAIADPDSLISISSALPPATLSKLCMELSQATYNESGAGKMLINKQPDGSKSPNLADAVMITYAPREPERRGFFDF